MKPFPMWLWRGEPWVARNGTLSLIRECRLPEPLLKMECDARRVPTLPPTRGAVIYANRLPIVACAFEGGKEYPAGGVDVETRVVHEPMTNSCGRAPRNGRKAAHPPTVHLEGTEVMAAIGIRIDRANPAALLIA